MTESVRHHVGIRNALGVVPMLVSYLACAAATASKGICNAATAVLAFTLCLSATTPSVFGQSSCPQPAPTPASDPLHTIIPVHFDASTGDITVGSKTYCGSNPGFHLLALQRQPDLDHLDAPDMVWDETYTDAGSVNSALQTILNMGGGPIVMVNAVGGYGINLSDVAQALTSFGAYPDLQGIKAGPPFIFIGNGGLNPQAALQRGGSARPLDGYLAQDSNSNYTFTQIDFVHYDITTDGTIKIGDKSYKVADAGYKYAGCDAAASDSFHLVVVDRESPDTVIADNAYCTRQNGSILAGMATDLAGVTKEKELVFIATNGHPIPADWNFGTDGDAQVYPLAQQMARLGGYWETMVYLTPNDTYSLVGAPPPPSYVAQPRQRARESSSVYPVNVNAQAPTGELHGVLARVRGNWYSPLNADPTGLTNLGLYDILAQPPTPFPHPAGTDEMAAFQTINYELCGSVTCNVRNQYDNLSINIGTTYLIPLQSVYTKDPNGNDCTDSKNANLPYCVVRAQLLNEFTLVSNIRNFYTNVSGLWSSSGTVTIFSQLSAYDKVKSTLPAPPTAEAPSLAEPLVGLFLGLASEVPVVGKVFGLADVFFDFGTKLATDPKGNETIDLTSTIGELETQANKQFVAQANATGTLFEFNYQDWGKLNALGTALASASGPGSPWYWSSTATSQMLQSMAGAITEAAYQNIMPAAYAIGSYVPDSRTDQGWGWGKLPLTGQPYAYEVIVNKSSPYVPIAHPFWLPAYSVYSNPTDFITSGFADQPGTGTLLADGAWLAISAVNTPETGTSEDFQYQPPSQALLADLFEPVSQGGLGVYRPAFFEGWPFPRITCTQSFGNRGGYTTPGGCDWSSAKPITVRPGPFGTGLTIQAAQIASNQDQFDVQLTLFNSGTVTAKSIDLTSISLRTLAGSGKATLLSPAVSIQVNSLVSGDSTTVVLKLNIPPGVTKLAITEGVSVDFGQPELVQLSDGQVLYPQR